MHSRIAVYIPVILIALSMLIILPSCTDSAPQLPYLADGVNYFENIVFRTFHDLNNDGRMEILLTLAHQPQIIKLRSVDFIHSVDQINATRIVLHARALDTPAGTRIGVLAIDSFSYYYQEYTIESDLLWEIPLGTATDVNNDGQFNAEGIIAGFEDVNADGTKEAIIILATSYDHQPRGCVAIDRASRKPAWQSFWSAMPIYPYGGLADIDGDGKQEILLPTKASFNYAPRTQPEYPTSDPPVTLEGFTDERSWLLALETDGSLRWFRDMGGKFSSIYMNAIQDFDGDSVKEILVIATSHLEPPENEDAIIIIDAAAGEIERIRRLPGEKLNNAVAVADLDSDAQPEIVLSAVRSDIYILNAQLNILQQRYVDEGAVIIGLADATGDSIPELFISDDEQRVRVLDSNLQEIACLEGETFRGGYADLRSMYDMGLPNTREVLAVNTDTALIITLHENLASRLLTTSPLLLGISLILFVASSVFILHAWRMQERNSLISRSLKESSLGVFVLVMDARGDIKASSPVSDRHFRKQYADIWKRIRGEIQGVGSGTVIHFTVRSGNDDPENQGVKIVGTFLPDSSVWLIVGKRIQAFSLSGQSLSNQKLEQDMFANMLQILSRPDARLDEHQKQTMKFIADSYRQLRLMRQHNPDSIRIDRTVQTAMQEFFETDIKPLDTTTDTVMVGYAEALNQTIRNLLLLSGEARDDILVELDTIRRLRPGAEAIQELSISLSFKNKARLEGNLATMLFTLTQQLILAQDGALHRENSSFHTVWRITLPLEGAVRKQSHKTG